MQRQGLIDLKEMKAIVSRLLTQTPVRDIPVTVQKGLAKGARWSFLPHSAYWRCGGHEPDVEAAIHLHGCIRGATCWDLGTHFGIYTVGMAMAVGSEGQVVGFEPDPVSFKRCQHHVQINSLSWVKLFNAAVSDTETSVSLILSQGAGASTSHLAYESENPDDASVKITVPTVVLDKLVERGEIRPPQLLKIDIEGHGAKALKGACKTLATYRPTIVMSFHSQWEVEDTRKLLEPIGYRSFTCAGLEVDWPATDFRGTAIFRCL